MLYLLIEEAEYSEDGYEVVGLYATLDKAKEVAASRVKQDIIEWKQHQNCLADESYCLIITEMAVA